MSKTESPYFTMCRDFSDQLKRMETLCKGCGRPVLFVKDKSGKWQILDARAPVYFVYQLSQTGDVLCERTSGYVSHFSTCRKASEF